MSGAVLDTRMANALGFAHRLRAAVGAARRSPD